MKLSEFKKQLKQLEEQLLTEYNLTDKEVEVVTLDKDITAMIDTTPIIQVNLVHNYKDEIQIYIE